jgi:hypothetical protein
VPADRPPAEGHLTVVGRAYSPAEVKPLPRTPTRRHRACTQCGGYLQGSREFVGVCLNCAEGRGWVVQQVADAPPPWLKRK